MSVNVKGLLIFSTVYGRGWTETHYFNTQSTSLSTLPQYLATLSIIAGNRAQILGEDCTVVGLRASYPTVGAIASQNQFVNLPGIKGVVGTSWANSLAIQIRDASRSRVKILHLRGFPNSVVVDENYQPSGLTGAAFINGLNTYFNSLMSNNAGWLGVNANSFFGTVTTYTTNSNGTVTLSLNPSSTSGSAPPDGSVVSARFSRINHSRSVLNRTFPCVYAGPTTNPVGPATLTTTNAVSAGPVNGIGRFKVSVTAFVPYAAITSVELGERRMGKALNLYPGRAKRRPTA